MVSIALVRAGNVIGNIQHAETAGSWPEICRLWIL